MTHTVAHDLQNPIHHIKGLSSILKKDLSALQVVNEANKSQSLIQHDMIGDCCEKAYSIIKDLLLIGEIELGRQPLEKQATELKGFI